MPPSTGFPVTPWRQPLTRRGGCDLLLIRLLGELCTQRLTLSCPPPNPPHPSRVNKQQASLLIGWERSRRASNGLQSDQGAFGAGIRRAFPGTFCDGLSHCV